MPRVAYSRRPAPLLATRRAVFDWLRYGTAEFTDEDTSHRAFWDLAEQRRERRCRVPAITAQRWRSRESQGRRRSTVPIGLHANPDPDRLTSNGAPLIPQMVGGVSAHG